MHCSLRNLLSGHDSMLRNPLFDTFIYSLNPQTFCFGGLCDNITYFRCVRPQNHQKWSTNATWLHPSTTESDFVWIITSELTNKLVLLTSTSTSDCDKRIKKNKLQQNITTKTISFLSQSDNRLCQQTQSVRCSFISTHVGVSHCGFTPTPAASSLVWSLKAASLCTVAPCSCTCIDLGSWTGREDSFLVLIYVI